MRILGIITARGGSKSIPRKNIKNLAGKPLIAYTVEAARGSKLLTRTIISTDDEEIARISKEHGGDIPFLRPVEISGDKSTSLEAVQHALTWLKENANEEYDAVLILQPTSPLRTSGDIDACIQKMIDTGADSVMGMVELEDFSVKKLKRIENDLIVPFLEEEGKLSAMRQDLGAVYKRNAALYLTRVEWIRENDLFGKISRPYVMPFERSIDINRPSDFEIAEFFLKRRDA